MKFYKDKKIYQKHKIEKFVYVFYDRVNYFIPKNCRL